MGNENTLITIDPGIFDDEAAAADFTNHLQPQQRGAPSTQHQGEVITDMNVAQTDTVLSSVVSLRCDNRYCIGDNSASCKSYECY